jgi:hypothetical protein
MENRIRFSGECAIEHFSAKWLRFAVKKCGTAKEER